jgi:hypothetical protein
VQNYVFFSRTLRRRGLKILIQLSVILAPLFLFQPTQKGTYQLLESALVEEPNAQKFIYSGKILKVSL